MKPLCNLEQIRQQEQVFLDTSKKIGERNRLGQYGTPSRLALEIIQLAYEFWKGREDKICFLEPGFGTGPFYSALLQVVPETRIDSALGIELDSKVAKAARKVWKFSNIRLIEGDFVKLSDSVLSVQPNLIVCNPPYIRHHHLQKDQKQQLQDVVKKKLGLAINGLAGMYCYFLLLSHDWLRDGGVGIWLIPTEFMDVNYGKAIRDYLTSHVTLLRLHRFDISELQFGDALVSSAVVIFQKTPPHKGHQALFTTGGTLTQPQIENKVSIEALSKSYKWTKQSTNIQAYSIGEQHEITLGEFFRVRRGIATGANRFFILTREEARQLKLPEKYLRPILPSPRYLKDSIIEVDSDNFPKLQPQLVLVDCRLQEDEIQLHYPSLWKYLVSGKTSGVHKRYLASKRSPWYRQEDVVSSPFLCTYMGRNESDLVPFRFIWNQSQAIAPNVYLMLYPQPHLGVFLKDNVERQRKVFELLQQIDVNHMIAEGRAYGGGLYKIEPKELLKVPLTNIATAQELAAMTMLF